MIGANFNNRTKYSTTITLLIVAVLFLSNIVVIGNGGLAYTMKDYTTYISISIVIWFTGAVLAIGVFQKPLRISDLGLAIVGLISASFEYFIKAFAVNTWQMYFSKYTKKSFEIFYSSYNKIVTFSQHCLL
jgi:hypothetical protein